MTPTALALSLVLGVASPALPAKSAGFLIFPFDKELSQFIHAYHRAPDAVTALDRFFSIDFAQFERSAGKQGYDQHRSVLMTFFVCVLRNDPGLTLPFAERLASGAGGEQAAFGTELIAYSGTGDRDEALTIVAEGFGLSRSARAKLRPLRPVDYSRLEATDGALLDILWACYFATGDRSYLAKVAARLVSASPTYDESIEEIRRLSVGKHKPGSPTYAKVVDIAMGEAARMALTSVAGEDPATLLALRQLIGTVPGNVGSRLSSIVAEIESRATRRDR
jgi:hypothetical protein